MNVLILADRLHKTPDEIRRGFTVADYDAFLVYLKMLKEQVSR